MSVVIFIIKLALLAAFVIWLAYTPGEVEITWHGYEIKTSAAALSLGLLAVLSVVLYINKIWNVIIGAPSAWRMNQKIKHLEKGESYINQSLAAIAGGQPDLAEKFAKKAQRSFGNTPTTKLLFAQAAQLAGDHDEAIGYFKELTEEPETAILGYRGLIMHALRNGDLDEARRQAHLLEAEHPNLPWLNLVNYEFALQTENWPQAAQALGNAKRSRAIAGITSNEQEAALLLAQANSALKTSAPNLAIKHTKQALRLFPDNPACTLLHAQALIAAEKNRAAVRFIERTWKEAPHMQLVPLYKWALHKDKPLSFYKKVKHLTRHNPTIYPSLMALGEAALQADLWGEARRYLMALVHDAKATQGTYRLLAKLERRETKQERPANEWTAKAMQAPADSTWNCSSCGSLHEHWDTTCPHCHGFNTLLWRTHEQNYSTIKKTKDLLEALP